MVETDPLPSLVKGLTRVSLLARCVKINVECASTSRAAAMAASSTGGSIKMLSDSRET